ncbi:hypothetical protein PT274_00695 [Leuconostocaceae bacterium ESL0958]|nr:hypothetical protein [Leuconostocaceae bacterium ESL0958]
MVAADLSQAKAAAQAQLDQGDYANAAASWSTIYQEAPTFDHNQQLLAALVGADRAAEGVVLAQDFLAQYLQTAQPFMSYFDAVLMTGRFITARQLAQQAPAGVAGAFLLTTIADAEAARSQSDGAAFDKIAADFYHMANQPLQGQEAIYQQATFLPEDRFVPAALFLLQDPYLTAILRTTILSDLQQLGYSETVRYRWLDGQDDQVDLQTVAAPFDDPIYQQLLTNLTQLVGADDPLAEQSLNDQLNLEWLLLFPKGTVVTDPAAWVERDLASYYQELPGAEPAAQLAAHDLVAEQLGKLLLD